VDDESKFLSKLVRFAKKIGKFFFSRKKMVVVTTNAKGIVIFQMKFSFVEKS